MIVVTSTAKNAVGLAGRCVASVREAASRVTSTMVRDRPAVRHVFYAADVPTLECAQRGRGHGPPGELRLERPGMGNLANLLEVWRECAPHDIVVHLDGDDQLTPHALERVAHMYTREDVWLTYGSFVCDDGTRDWEWHRHFGRRYRAGGNPRHEPWRASHLKTFRAGLMQRIPRAYLERPDGALYGTCLDLAVMFPMLDMAGERYEVCTDVLHVYTRAHSFQANADTEAQAQEGRDREHICQRPPLTRLTERPW